MSARWMRLFRCTARSSARMVERSARLLLRAIGFVRRNRGPATVASLVTVLAAGLAYLSFGALQIDPVRSTLTVRVHLAESGGLMPGQSVTLRGVPVGVVRAVQLSGSGVVAVASVNGDVRIPRGGGVRVAGLSPAGEQYLDFRPDHDGGPYLADGAEIAQQDTSTPTPLYEVLGDLDGMLAQIDPGKLKTITDELGVGQDGERKLGAIVDGGTFLISTLDGILPQTLSLLRSSKIVLSTVAAEGPGLADTARGLDSTLHGVDAMDGGFRALLGTAPGTLQQVDAIFADNSPTMVQLLGNLATVSQLAYTHIPAMNEFFWPRGRAGSTLDAVQTAFHDGGLWGLVDIYPRYSCDYQHPRLPPSLPNFPEPYLNTYCDNQDPSVLIRGARNAPRPPGDDSAGPAPGSPQDQTADPTPQGPSTIPTPFGGGHPVGPNG